MKVSGMNFDQYKISIESHPLQVLYTKYNESDVLSQYQSVRPLGRIRQKRRPSSEYQRIPHAAGAEEKGVSGKIEMKLDKRVNSERMKYKCDQNNSPVDTREKGINTFPMLRRSKTQAFEEKFKIASSRSHGESPSPTLRQNKSVDKKVVHLPLFKINLRTYAGDEEVSRTVAKTRESLRKLMDLNKAKMRHANVVTANIKNYEFSAPRSKSTLVRENTIESPRTISQPFHAKPALRSTRDRELKRKENTFPKSLLKFGVVDAGKSEKVINNKSERETCDKLNVTKRHISDIIGLEDEPDSSMLSLAIRPDTSLTLGTTMHQIDRVIKSPTSEELRELSEAFKNSDTPPAWPSVDDIQTMIARNQSRTTKSRTPFSRPTTVLNNVPEIQEDFIQSRTRGQNYLCSLPHEYGHKHEPVLRYTSKQSTYKLDPIIVPSHTCTECPMCNIYQRDVETSCPPNTPNTSQFMYETENRPVFVRGTKITNSHVNQEVLHVARINMNGYASPEEDTNVLSFMKTV